MKKLVYLLPMIALALPACGDDATGVDTDDETGGTTTDTTGPSTQGSTTDETDPTVADTGTESGDPPGCTPDDECTPETVAEACGEFFACVGCFCVADGDPPLCPDGWGEGEYADCVEGGNGVCMSAGLQPGCLVDNVQTPTAGVCFYQGCEAACDCPAGPSPEFDDQVACDDITGDGTNDCFLECGDCPEGMFCDGGVCLHGEAPPFPDYADCLNEDLPICDTDGICLSNDEDFGVCGSIDCEDDSDCGEAPETGDAMPGCTEFPDGSTSFCSLTCDGGRRARTA